MNAFEAITRSISQSEIVIMPYDETVARHLRQLGDDWVEGNDALEYWGTDGGDEWRVHLTTSPCRHDDAGRPEGHAPGKKERVMSNQELFARVNHNNVVLEIFKAAHDGVAQEYYRTHAHAVSDSLVVMASGETPELGDIVAVDSDGVAEVAL